MPRDTGNPSFEDMVPKPYESVAELKPLYRGVWAEQLKDGMDLPMGGSLLHDRMSLRLHLDFATFEPELQRWTPESINKMYEENKDGLKKWLEDIGSDVDTYIFYVCSLVQKKMQTLLDVNLPEEHGGNVERDKLYSEGRSPALSELKGKTMCGERAAMGQYLLQRIGLESAYVGGITMENAKDNDEYAEAHSYIIVQDTKDNTTSYVFDIARPRSQYNLPRILRADKPITYDMLKDQSNLLVRTREVLKAGELWFGVGAPVAGHHKIVEKEQPI